METATTEHPMMPAVEPDGSSTDFDGGQTKVVPQNIDQAPEPEKAPQNSETDNEDVVDLLVPKAKSVSWSLGPNGEFEYIQRPLSFIAKMQWFSLVGEVLDKALSGPQGMSLNSLFETPGRPGELSMADFRDADTFVQAVGKLLSVAPDFLVKSYCIWLNVPDYQRDIVADIMAAPPEDGGLTDEQGIEIIEVFIDQNYEALDRFFRERLGGLQDRVQARIKDAQSSRQSRR